MRRKLEKLDIVTNDPKKVPFREWLKARKEVLSILALERETGVTSRMLGLWLSDTEKFRNLRDSDYEKLYAFCSEYLGYVEPQYREAVDLSLQKLRTGRISAEQFVSALNKI